MRRILAVVVVSVLAFFAAPPTARAEMAEPGTYLQGLPHPAFALPTGQYRTRLVWLVASIIAWEQGGPYGLFDLNARIAPGLYRNAVAGELAAYRRLPGPDHYRYADALVRDYAQLQILLLADSQTGLAFSPALASVMADMLAEVVVSGTAFVVPAAARTITSKFVPADAAASAEVARTIVDWKLRYQHLLGASMFEDALRLVASGLSAEEAAKVMTGSVLSTSINRALEPYKDDPARAFDMMRTQAVLEVAAYRCACALDQNTHRPPDAAVTYLGSTDSYRTMLGFVLGYRLAPPPTTLLNIRGNRTVDDFLRDELAMLRRLKDSSKPEDRARYGTYMRSLLVDIETLERAMIASLSAGSTKDYVDSTVLNVMFGTIASAAGGGLGPQAVAILANAGVGVFARYADVSAELQMRMEVAAFREFVLNELLPLAEVCGCGQGVVVVPDRVIQGASPQRQ